MMPSGSSPLNAVSIAYPLALRFWFCFCFLFLLRLFYGLVVMGTYDEIVKIFIP